MEIECTQSLLTGEDTKKYSFFFTGLDYFCSAVTSFIFYWLFSTFTSDPLYFESLQCKNLYNFSVGIVYFYYYLFLSYILLFVLSFISLCCKKIEFITDIFRNLILIVSFFAGLFFLLEITNALLQKEPCGDLKILAIIVAIIGWGGVILFVIVLVCSLMKMMCRRND